MKTWTRFYVIVVAFVILHFISYASGNEENEQVTDEVQITTDGTPEEVRIPTEPTPEPEPEILRINNRPTPWKFVPTPEPSTGSTDDEQIFIECTTDNEEVIHEEVVTEDTLSHSQHRHDEPSLDNQDNQPPPTEEEATGTLLRDSSDDESSSATFSDTPLEYSSSSFHETIDPSPPSENIPTRIPRRRKGSSSLPSDSPSSDSSSSSSSTTTLADDDVSSPILRPGTAIEFPSDTQMRTFTLCPSRRAVLVIDNIPHGNKNNNKWFSFLYAKLPFPFAYLVNPRNGNLIRTLEWEDRQMLPFGITEANDGRIGVTFYQGPLIEVWESHLNLKLTYHEQSLKPALPVFDTHQNLWVPFTIADRLDEEGEGVIMLWSYRPDGGRWEVYPRREFRHVKFPHTVHIDNHGRIYLTGLTSWLWIDGTFGQSFKTTVDPTQKHVRFEVYEIIPGDANDPAAEAEAKARHCEKWGGDCKDGVPLPHITWWGDSKAHSVVKPIRSYEFPSPFETCLWPLFILTGDGYAVCSCYDSDTIVIVKIGDVVVESSDNEYILNQGIRNHFDLRETNLPPTVLDEDNTNVLIELVPDDQIMTVLTIKNPYGIIAIGGLQMDPSGKGFAILDRTRRRVIGAPWPWPGLLYGPKHSTQYTAVDDEQSVTEHNIFNPGTVRRLTNVKIPR